MWYQLQIEGSSLPKIDELSETLENCGALAITLTDKNDDPILEPELGTTPLWPEVVINALFAETNCLELAKSMVAAQYPQLSFSIQTIEDQNWEHTWKDDFKPQRFGKKLWICPSWTPPPEPEGANLILDPGLAFGTGSHSTTSLCLSWLSDADLTEKTLIDYGCGSGILALAALKLGASKVLAADIDEQALVATRNNALNNRLNDEKLSICFPKDLQQPVDILIANILLAPLIELQTRFKELLKNQGTLVVSGVLGEQVPQLIDAYQEHFIYQSVKHLNEWSLLIFTAQ